MTDAPRSLFEKRPPIECSQGGIPLNKWHLDEKDDRIAALEREVAELKARDTDRRQAWVDAAFVDWKEKVATARAQVREQAAKVAWNISVMRQRDAEHWAKDNQELPLPLIVQVMNAEAKMARDLAAAIRAMPLEG